MTPLPRSALLIQLATARPRPVKAKPLDWRVQSKDWPHAGRPAHELRYSIYRDLWERGFFLSAAGKFGGDFLVYPGEFGLGLWWLGGTFSDSLYLLYIFSFVPPLLPGDLKQEIKYARVLLDSRRVVLSETGSHLIARVSLEFAVLHRLALECKGFLSLPPKCSNCRIVSRHLA